MIMTTAITKMNKICSKKKIQCKYCNENIDEGLLVLQIDEECHICDQYLDEANGYDEPYEEEGLLW